MSNLVSSTRQFTLASVGSSAANIAYVSCIRQYVLTSIAPGLPEPPLPGAVPSDPDVFVPEAVASSTGLRLRSGPTTTTLNENMLTIQTALGRLVDLNSTGTTVLLTVDLNGYTLTNVATSVLTDALALQV